MSKSICVRKVVYIAVSCLLLVVVGGIFVFGRVLALDRECRDFVDSMLPPILRTWDEDAFLNEALPEFLVGERRAKVSELFDQFAESLGPMKSYNGATGQVQVSATTQQIRRTIGVYVATATFEKGLGRVTLRLIKQDDRWRVYNIRTDSDVP